MIYVIDIFFVLVIVFFFYQIFIKALLVRKPKAWGDPTTGLTRIRVEDGFFGTYGVLNHPENFGRTGGYVIPRYRYFCKCGTVLTDGPCGGASVNAVCEKCGINYGCLP